MKLERVTRGVYYAPLPDGDSVWAARRDVGDGWTVFYNPDRMSPMITIGEAPTLRDASAAATRYIADREATP